MSAIQEEVVVPRLKALIVDDSKLACFVLGCSDRCDTAGGGARDQLTRWPSAMSGRVLRHPVAHRVLNGGGASSDDAAADSPGARTAPSHADVSRGLRSVSHSNTSECQCTRCT